MGKTCLYIAALALLLPLRLSSERLASHVQDRVLSPEEILTAEKLRTYCRACHGLEKLRFIYSDDDEELWQYIREQVAPNSGKLWVDAIYEVLNWPTDEPPPFSQKIKPNKDWMPKGSKRLRFADDYTEDTSSRHLMLEALEKYRR